MCAHCAHGMNIHYCPLCVCVCVTECPVHNTHCGPTIYIYIYFLNFSVMATWSSELWSFLALVLVSLNSIICEQQHSTQMELIERKIDNAFDSLRTLNRDCESRRKWLSHCQLAVCSLHCCLTWTLNILNVLSIFTHEHMILNTMILRTLCYVTLCNMWHTYAYDCHFNLWLQTRRVLPNQTRRVLPIKLSVGTVAFSIQVWLAPKRRTNKQTHRPTERQLTGTRIGRVVEWMPGSKQQQTFAPRTRESVHSHAHCCCGALWFEWRALETDRHLRIIHDNRESRARGSLYKKFTCESKSLFATSTYTV